MKLVEAATSHGYFDRAKKCGIDAQLNAGRDLLAKLLSDIDDRRVVTGRDVIDLATLRAKAQQAVRAYDVAHVTEVPSRRQVTHADLESSLVERVKETADETGTTNWVDDPVPRD